MTDIKLLTLMLKELNEMIMFLQVRCYYKFRMTLHKSICKNYTAVAIVSIAVYCFKASEEEGGIAQCINATIRSLHNVPIVRSTTYDFFY